MYRKILMKNNNKKLNCAVKSPPVWVKHIFETDEKLFARQYVEF